MSRHFSMSFSSVLSIAIALILAMTMSVLSLNVARFAAEIEDDLQIQVSLSPALEQQEREQLEAKIKSLPEVDQVEFSDRNSELEKLIEAYGSTFEQYKDSNPLYDIFLISLTSASSIEPVSEAVEGMQGVIEVTNGGDSVYRMVSIFDSISLLAWILIIGLILLGIFLIRNTVSMNIATRQDEIFIMRHVGAYNFYISTPFILQGMIIGFWGSVVPILLCDGLYTWIYYSFSGQFISSAFQLYAPWPFLAVISLVALLTGLLSGALGSGLAVRRTIRSIR